MYNPKLAKYNWYNNVNEIDEITIKLFSGSKMVYRKGYAYPRGEYIKELHMSDSRIHLTDLARIVDWSLMKGIQEVAILGKTGDTHRYKYKQDKRFIFTKTNWVNNLERSKSFSLEFYDGSFLNGQRIRGHFYDYTGKIINFSKINYKAVIKVSIFDLNGRLFIFKEGE